MTRPASGPGRRWVRAGLGGVIVVVVVARLGSGPVQDGLRSVTPAALVVALVVTAGTTWCCARRWTIVAEALGDRLPVRRAYAAYYRSQLVNATLPGGVVGDLGRGLTHGLRAVVWERGVGQLVQLVLTLAVLLVAPSPVRWTAAPVALALAVLLVVAVLARRDVGRLVPAAGRLALLSAGSVVGHLAVFLVAARLVGTDLGLAELVAVGVLVLAASAVPTNVAGWGPREGVAAWAFAAVGSGATTGLAVSVTYGVLALAATLPGVVTLARPVRRLVTAHG